MVGHGRDFFSQAIRPGLSSMITQDRFGGRGAGSPISRPRCKMSVQGVRKAPEELANVGQLHI